MNGAASGSGSGEGRGRRAASTAGRQAGQAGRAGRQVSRRHLLGQLRQDGGGQLLRVSNQHHPAAWRWHEPQRGDGRLASRYDECMQYSMRTAHYYYATLYTPLSSKHQRLQCRHLGGLPRLINQDCTGRHTAQHAQQGGRQVSVNAGVVITNQCRTAGAAFMRTAASRAGRQGSTPVWKGALLADCWNTLRCSRAARRGQRQGGCVTAPAAGCGASAVQEQGHTHLACMHSWQQQQQHQ